MPTDTSFPEATAPDDPYRNYRFRLKWDGKYVAGVSKVGVLSRRMEPNSHRAGGDPSSARRIPGQSEYAAITLEHGATHDVAFEQWASMVWDYHSSTVAHRQSGTGNQDVSLKDFRKDIILEVYDEAGQKVLAYNIHRCWASEFVAVPEVDRDGVAFRILKLENEGWERDTSLAGSDAPGFTLPAS